MKSRRAKKGNGGRPKNVYKKYWHLQGEKDIYLTETAKMAGHDGWIEVKEIKEATFKKAVKDSKDWSSVSIEILSDDEKKKFRRFI